MLGPPKRIIKETKHKWWIGKNASIFYIVFVAILVILGLSLLRSNEKQSQTATNQICKNEVLDAAAKVYLSTPKNNQKLKKITEDIEKTSNFDKDINCLHIVLTYYVNIGWPEKAKEYLVKLESIYEQSNKFSVRLGGDAKTIEEFRKDIRFLEKVAKEMERNSTRTSAPKEVEDKAYDIKPPKGIEKPKNYTE